MIILKENGPQNKKIPKVSSWVILEAKVFISQL